MISKIPLFDFAHCPIKYELFLNWDIWDTNVTLMDPSWCLSWLVIIDNEGILCNPKNSRSKTWLSDAV